jgi:type VI protein secretion system component Hcp
MSIDGIQGPGIISAYEGWLLLSRFSWSGSRGVQKRADQRGRIAAFVMAPQLKAVSVGRVADMVSPQIWQLMLTLSRKRVKFVWLRTGNDGLAPFLQVTIENALITSMAEDAVFGQPEEKIEFTYDKVEIRVVNVDDSLVGPQDVATYALPQAMRG